MSDRDLKDMVFILDPGAVRSVLVFAVFFWCLSTLPSVHIPLSDPIVFPVPQIIRLPARL